MYPDGEVLTYDYDVGGQMHAVQGRKGSYDYPYVQRLDYDKFGQRTYVLHGNNTVSRYSYDPYNRRLSHLTVGKGDGNPFMDLSYGYDEVGNITDLANRATNNSPSQMGGATNYTYTYDDLYRLTDSSGTFDTPPGKQHRFTLSMGYDTIHNITHKTQVDVLRQPSGQEVTQKKTTYDWTYRYDAQQPHAPTHLGDRTFSYDANGNQMGWTHDTNGTRRQITWDDENRIRAIRDNGHRLTYTYDASGQRLTKRGPQGETGYINQWFTLRNGEVGTKHVYAGTTRVVSKLVKQDKPNAKRKGRIVYEKDQYTYHPDHLGTSAYITHTNGQVYQHLEYFPFGETWVEEHSNKQRTPYLFTAKELDEESQLYYFGARYYDPRTSVFVSMDPILNDYMEGDPNNGVFSPINMNLTRYAALNPLRITDPTGMSDCDDICALMGEEYVQYHQDRAQAAEDVAEGMSTAGDVLEAAAAPGGLGVGVATKGKSVWNAVKRLFGKKADDLADITANFTQKQLDKKFKHASDFGIDSAKKNPTTLAQYEKALKDHLSNPATEQKGTYGFVADSKVFFNTETNNAVVLDSADNFVTGFRLSPGTKQFENFMNNGILR